MPAGKIALNAKAQPGRGKDDQAGARRETDVPYLIGVPLQDAWPDLSRKAFHGAQQDIERPVGTSTGLTSLSSHS